MDGPVGSKLRARSGSVGAGWRRSIWRSSISMARGRFAARHRRGAQPDVAGGGARAAAARAGRRLTWAMARPGWCSARCPTGFPRKRWRALVREFRTQYAAGLCVETRPYPGIEAMLQRFAAAMPLAVLDQQAERPGAPVAAGSCGSTATSRTSSATATASRASRRPTPGAGCMERHGADADARWSSATACPTCASRTRWAHAPPR